MTKRTCLICRAQIRSPTNSTDRGHIIEQHTRRVIPRESPWAGINPIVSVMRSAVIWNCSTLKKNSLWIRKGRIWIKSGAYLSQDISRKALLVAKYWKPTNTHAANQSVFTPLHRESEVWTGSACHNAVGYAGQFNLIDKGAISLFFGTAT